MNTVAPPEFSIQDFKTGSAIIARLPLTNPPQAARDLERFLDILMAAPPDGDTYFRLLEHIRLPISFVTEDLAKRYIDKPLPLADVEEELFQQVLALWKKSTRAYAHCAEIDQSGSYDAAHAQRVATVLHRCVWHSAMFIHEHWRCRRELPWGAWMDVHGYYASAEEWEITQLAVPDALDPLGRSSNVEAAFAGLVLCDMASCYSLTSRQQTLVRRWSTFWAPMVGLIKPAPGDPLPTFVIDLMKDSAMRPVSECLQTEHVRCLDTSRLALHMTEIRQQLRKRVGPTELGLGEGYSAVRCLEMLDLLARPWAQAKVARQFARRATAGISKLCAGFEEMHFFILGREFEQPASASVYSTPEYVSAVTHRNQGDPSQAITVQSRQYAYSVDDWEVVNQSANGFRLARSTSGKKMIHGQLLALCPHNGGFYMLAKNTWLMQEKEGGLIAGMRLLPGKPVAIGVRGTETGGVFSGPYERAFLLPAIAAVNAEQSVILPLGWYRLGRVVEIYVDSAVRIRLGKLIDAGQDFERITYELA